MQTSVLLHKRACPPVMAFVCVHRASIALRQVDKAYRRILENQH